VTRAVEVANAQNNPPKYEYMFCSLRLIGDGSAQAAEGLSRIRTNAPDIPAILILGHVRSIDTGTGNVTIEYAPDFVPTGTATHTLYMQYLPRVHLPGTATVQNATTVMVSNGTYWKPNNRIIVSNGTMTPPGTYVTAVNGNDLTLSAPLVGWQANTPLSRLRRRHPRAEQHQALTDGTCWCARIRHTAHRPTRRRRQCRCLRGHRIFTGRLDRPRQRPGRPLGGAEQLGLLHKRYEARGARIGQPQRVVIVKHRLGDPRLSSTPKLASRVVLGDPRRRDPRCGRSGSRWRRAWLAERLGAPRR
jgi:hypothetical protein